MHFTSGLWERRYMAQAEISARIRFVFAQFPLGLLVTRAGGFPQPGHSQTLAPPDAIAIQIGPGKVVLGLSIAFARRFSPPFHGTGRILCRSLSFGVHRPQIARSPDMPHGGDPLIHSERPPFISTNPPTIFVTQGEVVDGLVKFVLRSLLVPANRRFWIVARAQAQVIAIADEILSMRISVLRRQTQMGKGFRVILYLPPGIEKSLIISVEFLDVHRICSVSILCHVRPVA